MPTVLVRDARPDDRDTVVAFNAQLAEETEAKRLDIALLESGVARALAEPGRLRYWIAEIDDRIVGQAAVSMEWSDWRDGWLWWLQSVYVDPTSRRIGVFRSLYGAIETAARAEGVVGLRLYVERDNRRAQETYRRLGMVPGGYEVYEKVWGRPAAPGPSSPTS